jgi:hypothetical protein
MYMKIPSQLRITLSLAAFLAGACAPAPIKPIATLGPASPSPAAVTVQASATEAVLRPTPVAAATSRGPDLEATDPLTVSLAAGEIQLVEFFRFT